MKKTLYVVGAIIIKDGRILAVKRGESKNKAVAYKYEFVGGKIEEGESPQVALKREVREEVGQRFMQEVYEYEDVFVNLQTYFCRPLSEKYELKEHLDGKWLAPEELFSVEWAPADYNMISQLTKIKL